MPAIVESLRRTGLPSTYKILPLPPPGELESRKVLKALIGARSALSELQGHARSIPNPGILIDTLSLQEAMASSAVENIITTQDEAFRAEDLGDLANPAQKEVARYRRALREGFDGLQRQAGLMTNNTIIGMFQVLKATTGGFRKTPGTVLRNDLTGETVYVPPQSAIEIEAHMRDLESYINAASSDLDPLVRMALIHHQFESIHPFPDGNGRIGRIISVLFLVQQAMLDAPILYLSRHVIRTKDTYYRLLQETRDNGDWEPWLLYFIGAVENIAIETKALVSGIRDLMADYKTRIRDDFRFYSQDLLNNLFRHPYTRIEYVMRELDVSRPTASRYLDQLAQAGILRKLQVGRNVYYVNDALMALFGEAQA